MASSTNCWRCLSRMDPPGVMRGFSTTSARAAMPVVKKGPTASTKGQKKGVKIKKKPFVKPSGRPPAPGERKALRKRIVLSNTNALEVHMKDLNREMVGKLGEHVGQVVGLEGKTVDGLRAMEAFKTTQGWGMFRRPGMLVRAETVKLAEKLASAEGEGKDLRIVVDGRKGTGKSILLLQGMALAIVRGWTIINIPEAQEIVDAMNDYATIPGTSPTLWQQPTYTANLLSQIGKANSAILNGINLSAENAQKVPIPLPSSITLARLCELGSRDPDAAWPIFQALWAELTAAGRPPILFAMDGLSYIMGLSKYLDTQSNRIHCFDLALIQHFTSYLSGAQALPNGGAVLVATNRSHGPGSKSMDLKITQQTQKQKGEQAIVRDPYERTYDLRSEAALEKMEVMQLGGLSKTEARSLMEYWAKSGLLRQRVDEGNVAERWAVAGNGIVAEIQRGALKMRI